ncbi:hypothetical protein BGX27_009772 [Mortierella sp. AM989]|nr:hypothetical protein BGX27_009772 [Mortierella sp. AM989]
MTPPKNNSNKNEKNNNPPEIPPWEQQNDTFIKILRTCRLYGLKTLVIRGLAQSIPSRPSYGECGTSAMWRMQFERFERDRDRSFAQIIKAAAAIITDANVTLTATSTTTTTATATSSEKVIEKQTGGIQRLVISNTTGFSSKSLAMILETSLSTTLEELDVQRCGYFRSEEMHFALSKLPNLKVVDFRCREKIPIITPYSGLLPKRLAEEEEKAILGNIKQPQKTTTAMMASTTTADGFPIIPPALWACRTSLRSLRIGVTNASIQKYNYDRNDLCIGFRIWIRGAETYWLEKHPETEKQYPEDLHWFFDQIATLTQLRELCLVAVKPEHHKTRSLELSLKTGLDRWSTLTALECLDVEELDHGIGLEDVQWMVESWPALKMIRGLVHEKDETPTDAVLWLKKARPDIELPISKVLRGMDALEAYYDEDDL